MFLIQIVLCIFLSLFIVLGTTIANVAGATSAPLAYMVVLDSLKSYYPNYMSTLISDIDSDDFAARRKPLKDSLILTVGRQIGTNDKDYQFKFIDLNGGKIADGDPINLIDAGKGYPVGSANGGSTTYLGKGRYLTSLDSGFVRIIGDSAGAQQKFTIAVLDSSDFTFLPGRSYRIGIRCPNGMFFSVNPKTSTGPYQIKCNASAIGEDEKFSIRSAL